MTLIDIGSATSARAASAADDDWVAVCTLRQMVPERGVAVLVDGRQVALFRMASPDGEHVHAVGHRDPFSGANVMARGIVGSLGDRETVASPMYKHVFDLATGVCTTDPDVRLPVHRTLVAGGVVHVSRSPVLAGVEPLLEAG